MHYASYFDDIIMESEGEKGSGSSVLIEAESLRTTVLDFYHGKKKNINHFTKKTFNY